MNTVATGQQKLIKWVNGIPVPITEPLLQKEQVKDLALAALSLPYEGEGDYLGLEPELFGHTKGEVMMIRLAKHAAAGDKDAIKILLDRILGRPEQSTKSLSVKMSYEEMLAEMAKENKANDVESKITDIT